jgi:hypothetical protein
MQKHLALLVLAVFGSTIVLSLFAATSVFAQDIPYSDGGDRNEYLQEMEHGDPEFYVPPVSEASSPDSSVTVE